MHAQMPAFIPITLPFHQKICLNKLRLKKLKRLVACKIIHKPTTDQSPSKQPLTHKTTTHWKVSRHELLHPLINFFYQPYTNRTVASHMVPGPRRHWSNLGKHCKKHRWISCKMVHASSSTPPQHTKTSLPILPRNLWTPAWWVFRSHRISTAWQGHTIPEQKQNRGWYQMPINLYTHRIVGPFNVVSIQNDNTWKLNRIGIAEWHKLKENAWYQFALKT